MVGSGKGSPTEQCGLYNAYTLPRFQPANNLGINIFMEVRYGNQADDECFK
jgi:hypothetical protein